MKQNYYIITLLLLICSFIQIKAQSPDSFKYQAVVRDASTNNIIANQQISLLITVHQNTINGAIIYEEEFNPTTNTFGLVNLEIGNGTAVVGIFEDIDWGSGPYFIETAIDQTGGSNHVSMGTSQLLSVPYALYAKNGSKWSESASGLTYNEGTVSIGQTQGKALFEINGNPNLPILESFETLLSSTISDASPDFFALQNGTLLSNQFIPVIRGHHETDSRTALFFLGSTTMANDVFLDTNPIVKFNARVTNGDNGSFVNNRNLFGWENYTESKMVLSVEGNLGVGTTNPGAKIQIADGDIFIEDINKGVIMKSPNGMCWRMTIDDTGNMVTTQVTCP